MTLKFIDKVRKFINGVKNRQSASNKLLTAEQTYQTSVEALKMIYYVIIGLAVTEALRITFVGQEGKFLGIKAENRTEILLLLAFLFTLVRFVHGASIHLEMAKDPKTRWKPLWDFAGFFLHGSLIYMMAVSLKEISTFLVLFTLMLIIDALWILIIRWIGYIKKLDFTHGEGQWFISDVCIALLLGFIYVVGRSMSWSCVWLAVAILIIAIVAAIADYFLNMRFYFPKQLSQK